MSAKNLLDELERVVSKIDQLKKIRANLERFNGVGSKLYNKLHTKIILLYEKAKVIIAKLERMEKDEL